MQTMKTKNIEMPRNELIEFLVKEFGIEAIGNYVQEPLPTIILCDSGFFGKNLKNLEKIGWTVAGIHANDKGVLQIGFKEL